MKNLSIKAHAIWVILLIHFVFIFILSASSTSLPSDMLENLFWGRSFHFAYDKHPPFFAWESYFTVRLFGGNLLFYHILTPLNQVALLYFIYKLGLKILLKPEKALLAVVLCQGIIYHTFYYKFNGNTANLGFYGAIYFVFYTIVKEEKYKLLPLLGALCGIIMLIKYSAIILIGIMGLIGIATKEGRKALKSLYIIPAILLFFVVIAPNLYEVFILGKNGALLYLTNQSLDIKYRWYEVPRFVITPFLASLPMIITFILVKKKFVQKKLDLNLKILGTFTITPFVIVLIYMVLFKAQVGVYWLSMFYAPLPLFLVYLFEFKKEALKKAMKVLYTINAILYIIHLIPSLANPEDDTKKVAEFINEVQAKHFESPVQDFICNEIRRTCATVLIFGTDYTKVNMEAERWKNPFTEFNNLPNRPKNIIVVGKAEAKDLPDYTLFYYKKDIPKYHKFKIFEKLFANPPKVFAKELAKLEDPIKIELTVAIKNE